MTLVDWSKLIAQHDHQVVLALLARGIRIGRARELAHETWARLFEQHQAGLLPVVELPGLAIRQAWFLACKKRKPTERLNDEAMALLDPRAGADHELEVKEALNRAHAALATCGPRAQTVFAAALACEELPHKELAPQLGLSLQRLRQTLCEVRARLRAAVDTGDL